MAASAVWHGAETRAAFCCKHLSAAGPPGCTPEHCAMKSDRHAARMALSCSLLGFCDEAGVAAAGDGSALFVSPRELVLPERAVMFLPLVAGEQARVRRRAFAPPAGTPATGSMHCPSGKATILGCSVRSMNNAP